MPYGYVTLGPAEPVRCDLCPVVKAVEEGPRLGRRSARAKALLFRHHLTAHANGEAAKRRLRRKGRGRWTGGCVDCDVCGHSARTPQCLAGHMAQVHRLGVPGRIFRSSSAVPCEDCGKVLSNKHNLASHQRVAHGVGPATFSGSTVHKVSCDHCPKVTQKTYLFGHWLLQHSSVAGSGERLRRLAHRSLGPPELVSCDVCSKRFHRNNLWLHWDTRHGRRLRADLRRRKAPTVACDDCGEAVTKWGQWGLVGHLRKHRHV